MYTFILESHWKKNFFGSNLPHVRFIGKETIRLNSFHALDLLLRNGTMFIIGLFDELRIKLSHSLNNDHIESLRPSDSFKVMKLMNIRVGMRMTVTWECFSIAS